MNFIYSGTAWQPVAADGADAPPLNRSVIPPREPASTNVLRSRTSRIAALLTLLLPAASCEPRTALQACAAYWPDVAVVEAPAAVPIDRPSIRLEEIWRAGGSIEGQELAFPASIAVSPSGYTAVVDHQLAEVVVLTPDGRWLGPWARRGRGPGELTMPVAANWRGDTLLVFDIEQAKVSTYAAGSVVGSDLQIAPGFISPVITSGEIDYVAVRSDGAAVLKQPLRPSSSSSDTAILTVLMQRPGATIVDTIAQSPVRIIRWRGGLLAQPGGPQPRVTVGPNGWLVTSAPDGTYRILIRDALNTPVRQICRETVAHALTPAETGRDATPAGFEEPTAAIANAPPPTQPSQIGRIIAGPAGELWVDRTRAEPFTAEALFGVPGSLLDVYDEEGAFVGEVQLPVGVSIQAISSTMAIALQFTELNEPWIVGYRVTYGQE